MKCHVFADHGVVCRKLLLLKPGLAISVYHTLVFHYKIGNLWKRIQIGEILSVATGCQAISYISSYINCCNYTCITIKSRNFSATCEKLVVFYMQDTLWIKLSC